MIGWNARPSLQNNVTLDSPAQYCASETERQNIITTYTWIINDAGLNAGCATDSAPTVTTQSVSAINSNTATGNGIVTDTGNIDPERFIEWGTVSGTYTNECSAGIDSAGAYSCVITGLSPNTTYFVRAKAINSEGTGYGVETSFTTTSSVTSAPRQFKFRGTVKMKGHIRIK